MAQSQTTGQKKDMWILWYGLGLFLIPWLALDWIYQYDVGTWAWHSILIVTTILYYSRKFAWLSVLFGLDLVLGVLSFIAFWSMTLEFMVMYVVVTIDLVCIVKGRDTWGR